MSSSQKTGGNKKSASASDEAYFARRKNSKIDEINKAKRAARHALRMKKKAAHRVAWEVKKASRKSYFGAQA